MIRTGLEVVLRYSFVENALIVGELPAVWRTATGVNRWSEWDPHWSESWLEGPFRPGTNGWVKLRKARSGKTRSGKARSFTITHVDRTSRVWSWSEEVRMPFGKICATRTYEAVGEHNVRLIKTIHVHGPIGILFPLVWESGMRAQISMTFDALEREAARGEEVAGR